MSIRVENISKQYKKQKAVDDISFTIDNGEIVGFLGPNGAGKSTTMKIITGFINADAGSVEVNGLDIDKNPLEVRRQIGYLPEHNPLYPDMYIREYLRFSASMYLPKNQIGSAIDLVMERTGLLPEGSKKIGALSKGYRQRVGLAQALIHDPKVLILDEPTTGLDPNQIVEIRDLISEIGREKTIMLSTHIMQEVEAICNRVLIIDKGKIVADNNNGFAAKQDAVFVAFVHAVASVKLMEIEGVVDLKQISERSFVLFSVKENDIRANVFTFCAKQNLTLLTLKQQTEDLETTFRELTKN